MSREQDIKLAGTAPGSAEVSRLGSEASNRLDAVQMRDALSDAIRTLVLPRLLERRHLGTDPAARSRPIRGADLLTLRRLATISDPGPAEALIRLLRRRGASREAILLDLIAPTERRLGDLWRRGRLTFADMTLGIGLLRGLMRSDCMPQTERQHVATGACVLVASLPGEQLTLGTAIIADLFGTAGWSTITWSGGDAAELLRIAAASPVDIVAMTIGDAGALSGLRQLAGRLRMTTGQRLACILIGGEALEGLSCTAADLGIDILVTDAHEAVAAADALLSGDVAGDFSRDD